ncbi:MAG TPA: 2Fe-2S iron-sulfur cluster binding domain-containing protein [Pseudonocardia sp.]|jgi:NAD(P)H-flavin reductase/ferredoxin|nr:2Fe-2S iron-sulfur cluster binding domain-containing protein [Pseudonocardia sp.]
MGLFTRRGPRVVTLPGGRSFTAGRDSVLNHALAEGVPFPHSCTVGTCGSCKSRLVSGKVWELTESAITLSSEELRSGYILPCQSVARGPLELDVPGFAEIPDHPLRHTSGVISGQRPLTHDIVELRLELDEPIEYTGGQYAELSTDHLTTGPRAYSFAEAPNPAALDRPCFYVRRTPGGEFTEWLFDADRTGTRVNLTGPFGNLWLRPGEGPVLCVAGGSGLAPVKALVETAAAAVSEREFVLVFGARTQRDLYCVDELEKLAVAAGSLRFVPVLSEEPVDSGWTWARGLVTDVIATLAPELLAQCDAYVCGPPPMVDAVEDLLCGGRADEGFFHADRFLDRSFRGRAG